MLYNEDSSTVERLLIKKEQNRISPEELAYLEQLLKENPEARAFAEFYQNGPLQKEQNDETVHAVWQELEAKMLRPKISRIRWFAVAASVLIIASTAGFLALKHPPEKNIATSITLHLDAGQDIDLSTNQTIKSGTASITASQESMDLRGISGAEKGWNTIEIPQRFEYTLHLSDGTAVTLNSSTKLKFPFSFSTDKREVYVEGEAYFRIAQNADRPFIVHTSRGDITVLGTEFNVNTYDAGVLKTALVNGAVNVSKNKEVIQLKPGEELSWDENKHIISTLDERATLSWIHGVLYFHNTPLSDIAGMIERWYGVPVEIDDKKLAAEPFTGNLEKSQPLEDFLVPMKGIVKMRCYYKGNVLHMAR